MKNYTKPLLELVDLEVEDVILSSGIGSNEVPTVKVGWGDVFGGIHQ